MQSLYSGGAEVLKRMTDSSIDLTPLANISNKLSINESLAFFLFTYFEYFYNRVILDEKNGQNKGHEIYQISYYVSKTYRKILGNLERILYPFVISIMGKAEFSKMNCNKLVGKMLPDVAARDTLISYICNNSNSSTYENISLYAENGWYLWADALLNYKGEGFTNLLNLLNNQYNAKISTKAFLDIYSGVEMENYIDNMGKELYKNLGGRDMFFSLFSAMYRKADCHFPVD